MREPFLHGLLFAPVAFIPSACVVVVSCKSCICVYKLLEFDTLIHIRFASLGYGKLRKYRRAAYNVNVSLWAIEFCHWARVARLALNVSALVGAGLAFAAKYVQVRVWFLWSV